jgi:hypothetical protein
MSSLTPARGAVKAARRRWATGPGARPLAPRTRPPFGTGLDPIPPIPDEPEFVPGPSDWRDFFSWLDGADPDPTPEDWAWDAGYRHGREGRSSADGLHGALRPVWELGFQAGLKAASAAAAAATGRAIDAAGGLGKYLEREQEKRLGVIPRDVARWIADHRLGGHDDES